MVLLIILMLFWQTYDNYAGQTGKEAAKLALEYVSRIEKNPCTGGTEETLDLTFNHTAWEKYTQPAILTANFLTSVIMKNSNSLDSLTDEMFFSLVRNNVNSIKTVFGSCIAIEPGIYSKHRLFAPYSYRQGDFVLAHDIALSYMYQDNKTEWYYNLKVRNWENATRTIFKTKYRSGKIALPEQEIVVLTAKLEDGHWTKPYFDCGGGDIWMVTFSSPIFSLDLKRGRPKFQGIASVDIQLTNIDINQCDQDSTHINSDIDVFRGTHRCPSTTECKFIEGQGFQRGAYECVCSEGYFFPDINAKVKAFSGLEMENSSETTQYKCLPCKEGCSECDDDSPCLYEYQFLFRFLLLLLTLLTFIAIGALIAFTAILRNKPVIKAGSPMFLLLMCAGGLLVCTTGFIAYPKPSEFICATQTWVFHIGFSLMYGALVAKTWRIAIIFKSANTLQRVYLPDKELLKRFFPLIFIIAMFLLIWTISESVKTEILETSNHLKYEVCLSSYLIYAIQCVEALLLLLGVYLCYVVRKAPGHFNESKYITWAVYNGILLGSFLLILTHVIGHHHGPGMLYLFECLQIQVFATITLTLIYVPKLIALYRNDDVKKGSNTFSYGGKNNKTNSIDIVQSKDLHSYEIKTAVSKSIFSSEYLKMDTDKRCTTESIGTQTILNTDMDNL
ncbi:metabotropic glycine receptor-like [Mytilus edulis]|uniref:metabotropic glycine receptor-like n=1 Tax=Mytilus edulis TaxID=6550 RepID=UPI0039EE2F74